MATHSSTLAWKIPWMEMEERGSPWGHKESDTTERLHFQPLRTMKRSSNRQNRGFRGLRLFMPSVVLTEKTTQALGNYEK